MSDIESMIFGHPASVLTRATNDELLALAQKRVPDPSVFDEMAPYFFSAEITNNKLDSYFTKMAPSSLKNYAADATAGVSFQNSHRTDDIGIGYSLTGNYNPGGTVAKVIADFYTVRGLPDTDVFIRKLQTGLARDVSIGFYGGRFICSICGRDMLRDWDCSHIPGWEEEVEADGTVRQEIAWASVEDAHLAETSIVYDGATPGAAILKAQQESINGRIRPEAVRFIEQRYRIHLPGAAHSWPGFTPDKENRTMAEENTSTPNPPAPNPAEAPETTPAPAPAPASTPSPAQEPTRAVDSLLTTRSILTRIGIAQEVGSVEEGMRLLATEVERLRPLADDGTKYRTDLIADALAEGVRATGKEFARETYEGILKAAPIETIKRMRDDWKRVGDSLFPGGRQTVDEAEAETVEPSTRRVPERAFA